jgi:flagellar FliJ protein
MLKSKRLQPVIKVAQSREDDAVLALNEYRKVIDQHQAKLIELRQYHAEYTQRLNDSGRTGLNIAQINDYRNFIARLAVAVKQQEELLESCEVVLKEKHDAWMLTRVHHQALDKVVDRYQEQEHQESEKREQAESDERAQRMGRGGHSK